MRNRGGFLTVSPPAFTSTSAGGIFKVNDAAILRAATQWPRGPLAPTSLTATAGNGQLSLSWTAPATTHGMITNYLVEYTPSGGSAAYVLTNSTGTSYTLTGLTNSTSYSVRVAAVNFTAGDWSATASGTPDAIIVTGGTITTPGDGYKYHAFNSSGTFTVSVASLQGADVLVVGAGAGGGRTFGGGGGGGGGVLYQTNQTIPPGSYVVTVAIQAGVRQNGGSSSIGALYIATGGLTAGSAPGYASDGGSSGFPTTTSNSSGNSGGGAYRNWDAEVCGGGGGGAGTEGQNGQSGACSLGGSGRIVFGTEYGKGGLGRWGNGDSGTGFYTSRCGGVVNGSPNSGQGGSGGDSIFNDSGAGTGGSGRVIIRYPST